MPIHTTTTAMLGQYACLRDRWCRLVRADSFFLTTGGRRPLLRGIQDTFARLLTAAGLPADRVAADEAFGMDWRFRRMLEELQVGYVLAVPKSQYVPRGGRIETLIGRAPAERGKP